MVSELVAASARKPVFGYKFVAGSSIAIAVIGFLVWGHHMFVSGQSMYASAIFSFLSLVVAVPSGIKVYNWTATLYKGQIALDPPFLFALSFIGLFVVGGLTGLMLAMLAIDVHVHDTYFVVAHFHYIMVGGTVSAFFGALHFWWPKITGRLYPLVWGRLSALLIFARLQPDLLPAVHPRLSRACRGATTSIRPSSRCCNVLSSAGASILAVAYVLPFIYLFWSLRYGAPAGANPWDVDRAGMDGALAAAEAQFRRRSRWSTRPPYDYPIEVEGDDG